MSNPQAKKYRDFALSFHSLIDRHVVVILIVLTTLLSLAARYLSALFPTGDTVNFIFRWMDQIEEMGFKNFYKAGADYSSFYLFFIAVFSLLPKGEVVTINNFTFYANRMYYIKSFYFLIDIILALGIYLLIKELTDSKKKALIGYMIFLVLPVQYANSAIWGNCDCLWMVFFVYIFYFLAKGKSFWVWLFFGFSISLKMQGVFILPFLIYLSMSRKLKFYTIYGTIIGLAISFLPAWICGASFLEPLAFFTKQVGGYSQLTLGCANMWHLFGARNMDSVNNPVNIASIVIGFSLIFVLTAIIYLRKIELSKVNILACGTFLISIVPFFLPHMHERYFYCLDVLVVIYCLVLKKHYYLIPLMQVSSGIAYYHYLSGKYFIEAMGEDSVSIAAWINLLVLVIIFIDLFKLNHKTLEEDLKAIESEREEKELSNSEQLTEGL